jgi:F0F1-type ATP synthase membrane subunit a
MNSYFVPTKALPVNASWQIDLADYVHIATDYKNPSKVLTNWNSESNSASVIHLMSSYFGVWIQLLLFLLFGYIIKYKPESKFSQTFTYLFESIFDFFEGIIGEENPRWMKLFSVTMFFTLLIANSLWYMNDILRFFFPFLLRNVTFGTGELEFNVAMALVWSIAILAVQHKTLGWTLALLHEYVPITGKWLADSKGVDIVVSLFTWLLDIIGFFARIISLALRLFGNMSAWSILLNVAFLWLGAATIWLLWFNLPVLVPMIVYLLGILSVIIQAFVFTLIVAIGMKMAT